MIMLIMASLVAIANTAFLARRRVQRRREHDRILRHVKAYCH